MTLARLLHGADPLSRRDFLAGLASGLLGVGAASILPGRAHAFDEVPIALGPATARQVIYLYMGGGMSHLDTLDPKPGAATQGPTGWIRTVADDVIVSEHFPLLAAQMDKVAVVRSLQSTQGAHAQGTYAMHTSYEMRGTIRHPSLGAWAQRMAGGLHPTLPAHVCIGGGANHASRGFFDSRFVPLPIGDPEAGLQHAARAEGVDSDTFTRRLDRVAAMNAAFRAEQGHASVGAYADMYEQAVRLMDSSDLAAFDITAEPESLREAYGRSTLGRGCLLARRLIEHGVRWVEVVSGGWDTHSDNFESMLELCPPLDRALAVLLADLEARGRLDETLVVLATEFGRSPQITEARQGRNHHPQAFSGLLAGGGIVGGRRWGATDATGTEVIEDAVPVADFNATIAHALGLPLEHELCSESGRPFQVAHDGRPVRALFR